MAYKDSTDLLKHIAHTQSQDDIDFLLRERVARILVPAEAAAADTANYVLLDAEADIELVSISLYPSADVTANNTNFATLDINKEDGAGGGMTSLDAFTTETTGSGDWSARVEEQFSGIAVTDTVDEGELVILEVTKDGTGVQLPDMLVEVWYRVL